MKKCQWTNPLTKEDADHLGTSCDKIDCHPKSKNEKTLFFQTPNMPKYQLSLLVKSWSSERGLRESHRGSQQVIIAPVAHPVVTMAMPSQLQQYAEEQYSTAASLVQLNSDNNSIPGDIADIASTTSYFADDMTTYDIPLLDRSDSAMQGEIAETENTTKKCQGVNHVQVRTFLCSNKASFAMMRGMALTCWKYNYISQMWHAVKHNGTVSVLGRINCDACYCEQKK